MFIEAYKANDRVDKKIIMKCRKTTLIILIFLAI